MFKFVAGQAKDGHDRPRVSLVLARPMQGRWHQIRRHLNGISHLIIGDSTHSVSRVNREWREGRNVPSEGGDEGRNKYAEHRDAPSSSMERDGYDVVDERYHDDIGLRTYYEFDRRDNDGYDRTPSLEWETHQSTSILFPPHNEEEDDNNRGRWPRAIVYFVGGTFFGSYPRRFYGSLLEDISIKSNAVVIATPMPIVLPGVRGLADRVERWMFDGQERDGGYDHNDGRIGPRGGRRGWYDGRENVASAS